MAIFKVVTFHRTYYGTLAGWVTLKIADYGIRKCIGNKKAGLSCAKPKSKKGKEPRNQVPRKVSISEEGLERFPE